MPTAPHFCTGLQNRIGHRTGPIVAIVIALSVIALWETTPASARMMGGGFMQRGHGPVAMGRYGRNPVATPMKRYPSGMSGRYGSRGVGSKYPPRGEAGYPRRPRHPIIVGPPGGFGPPPVVILPPTGGRAPPAAGGTGPSGPAASRVAADARFVPDEVLVSFNADVPQRTLVGIAQRQHLALLAIHRLSLLNIALYRFRITDRRAVPAVIASLQADRRIATVQPNFLYSLLDTDQPASGDPAQYVLSKLKIPQAHEVAKGSRVLVAVIDSAIDASHPELAGSIAAGFDSVRGSAAPHGHGTAMASAIAAHGRVLGVAPAARIVAIRAFEAANAGARGTTTRILDGLQYAADTGARVVNMSFAGPADPKLRDMVAAVRKTGAVLVAAAGNDGPKAGAAYPAAYPDVIAVTATDVDDKAFAKANRGAYVAVAAPGVDIFVAAPDGGYTTTTGTSVAAAHVSGLAALLLERDPNLKPDAIRAILTRTAHDLGPAGRDDDFGAGLVDAQDALLSLAPKAAEQAVGN